MRRLMLLVALLVLTWANLTPRERPPRPKRFKRFFLISLALVGLVLATTVVVPVTTPVAAAPLNQGYLYCYIEWGGLNGSQYRNDPGGSWLNSMRTPEGRFVGWDSCGYAHYSPQSTPSYVPPPRVRYPSSYGPTTYYLYIYY